MALARKEFSYGGTRLPERYNKEGLYFRWPVVERVVKLDIKIQKDQVETNASLKDLQQITTEIALNFRLNPDLIADVYQHVGVKL